jgi:hypothetical protein
VNRNAEGTYDHFRGLRSKQLRMPGESVHTPMRPNTHTWGMEATSSAHSDESLSCMTARASRIGEMETAARRAGSSRAYTISKETVLGSGRHKCSKKIGNAHFQSKPSRDAWYSSMRSAEEQPLREAASSRLGCIAAQTVI